MISVIMPAYNAASTLPDAVTSVLAQSYTDWELLVYDDGSRDGTADVLQAFCRQDARIKVFRGEKLGAAKARNFLIEQSAGRFIAFLDSDDAWLPEKLQKQVGYMLERGVPFCASWYQKIDGHGQRGAAVCPPARLGKQDLLKTNQVGCLTAIYDVAYFGKQYMPDYRWQHDLALWLRLLDRTTHVYVYPEILALYRTGRQSLSSNKLGPIKMQWRLYREFEGMAWPRALFYFLHYAIFGYLKHRR